MIFVGAQHRCAPAWRDLAFWSAAALPPLLTSLPDTIASASRLFLVGAPPSFSEGGLFAELLIFLCVLCSPLLPPY